MKNQMIQQDYFDQSAIIGRLERRHRRSTIFRVHVVATLMLSLLVTFMLIWGRDIYIGSAFSGSGIFRALFQLGVFLAIPWLLVFFHYFQKRSSDNLDAAIDAEMREARAYDVRSYGGRDDDAVYRLSEDGELFYDEELAYDLKPKRKREG
jgi:hypothetical protein